MKRPTIPLQVLRQPDEHHMRSTWRQARPARIERMLAASQQVDPGGWLVAAASADVRDLSTTRTIAGREVVLWRGDDGVLHAGPGSCPHLGALLGGCVSEGGDLLCRWHGMALPREGGGAWREFPAHDDGALAWVRLPMPDEEPADAPVELPRPPLDESIIAVVHRRAVCEPSDIIANRLDPWHGAWFHPYAFSHLTVDEQASTDDRLVVDVAFRLNRTIGVPVTAVFTTPDARTITMEIIDGEGLGSVVETHATPTGVDEHGRALSVMTEATIAHSDRTGFRIARAAQRVVTPLIRHTQGQLWVDDLAYAERRYEVRRREGLGG